MLDSNDRKILAALQENGRLSTSSDSFAGMSELSTQVRDNPGRQRYELRLPEGLAYATYQQRGEVLAINHSEVPPEVEGRGIGSALVQGMLDDIRKRGLKVLPLCGFVAAYIRRHKEYQDLLAAR